MLTTQVYYLAVEAYALVAGFNVYCEFAALPAELTVSSLPSFSKLALTIGVSGGVETSNEAYEA